MKMIFEDGFFHADPHPGNFFVEPGGRIGLIDFGMVGAVDERTRRRLAELLVALMVEDADRLELSRTNSGRLSAIGARPPSRSWS